MLYKTNARSLLVTTAVVSWALLLANVLFSAARLRQQDTAELALPFLHNLLIVVFLVSVFLFQRLSTETLKGIDFIGYLWNLFSKAGVAAYLSVALFLGYRVMTNYTDTESPLLLHLVYQVNFGLLVIFLAKAFYIWRQLLLYHKNKFLQIAWFELIRNGEPQVTHLLNVNNDQIKRIRHLLLAYNIHNIDYINNNLNRNPGFRDLMLPWKSLIILPIKSKSHLAGVLYLLKDIEQGFDRETVNVLRTFTSQTILTIENLRLIAESLQNERYKEELKIATQVQDSLIPKKFPVDSWFEISTHAMAAKEVGGDFYDFLQLSESRIAIIIGDVSGKGISAAFHMAQMKGIFHGLMQQDMPPSEFMKQANSALSRCLEKTSFITSALYIIDYSMKGFMFARAGHCHTLYYNAMMDDVFYFQTDGLGLGIIRDKSYGNHIREMYYDYNPGDVMVIYTDGIVEARNNLNEEYGEDRLKFMLQQTYHLEAEDIKYAIINDLQDFTGPDNLYDDQTLLVIKFKPGEPNKEISRTVSR